MLKLNEKGIVSHLVILLLLIAGLAVGLYLIKTPKIFRSRATYPPIVFKDINGGILPVVNGIPQATSASVKIEFTSTLTTSPPTPSPTPSPSLPPYVYPVCSGNSCADCILNNRSDILPFYQQNGWDISCSNQVNIVNNWCGIDPNGCQNVKNTVCLSVCGSTAPPVSSTTVLGKTALGAAAIKKSGKSTYRFAEDPATLDQTSFIPYTQDPMVVDYTFKDSTPGSKFIWVDFKGVKGQKDRRSAQINIVIPDIKPFSVGTNVTGIIHYGYTDINPFCYANAGYAVGGEPLPSPGSGGGGANLYVDPNQVGLSKNAAVTATADSKCSININPSFAAGLGNCTGGCGDGGVTDGCTCGSGNPKDSRACWWRWTCTATTSGSYAATFNTIFLRAPSSNIDSDLAEMQRMGMRIIRIFAGNKYIDDNEAAGRLGIFLDKANGYGVSVIVSFIDYYNSGFSPQGLDQYYTGNYNGIGLLGHEFFTTGYQGRYKDFVRSVVTANKNKSNIYAWEPGNELTDSLSPPTLLNFMKDISATIKSIDTQHAVAAGVLNSAHTGLSPQDLYSQLPNVDIVTVHTYDGDRSGAADVAWAKSNNKKAIVEEFGFSGSGDRSTGIQNELNYWKDQGASGVLQWGFIAKGLPDNGNGDNRFGMDTIWHTDYDKLDVAYKNYN